MAIKDALKAHRTWEDGVGLWLGLTIGLTPWLYEEASVPGVVLNSTLTGLAVLMLAQLEIIRVGGKKLPSWRVGSGSSPRHLF
jgi:hypothetical protein